MKSKLPVPNYSLSRLNQKIKFRFGLFITIIGLTFLIFLSQNPVISPDSEDILKMASIFSNKGCISYLENCQPTTTDHGPFYPLIASILYKFKVPPELFIIYAQTLFHIICCALFGIYIKNNYKLKSVEAFIFFGLSLLNPISLGWQRYILPDAFCLDICLLVLILIDMYNTHNEYKLLCLSGVLICIGSLFRYDSYILLIPLISSFFFNNQKNLKNRKSKLKFILLVFNLFLISSITLSIWVTRNIKLGLPPIRESFFSAHHDIKPEVIDWIKSWTISTYDLPKGIYPYLSPDELVKVTPPTWALSDELNNAIEEDPQLRKENTAILAKEKAKLIRSNFLQNNFNNLKRILWISLGPFYSGGLNIEKPPSFLDLNILKMASIKFLNFFMRIIIYLLTIRTYLRKSFFSLKTLHPALIFLIVDIGFCLFLGQLEQRYINDSILYLQFSLIFFLLRNMKSKACVN